MISKEVLGSSQEEPKGFNQNCLGSFNVTRTHQSTADSAVVVVPRMHEITDSTGAVEDTTGTNKNNTMDGCSDNGLMCCVRQTHE